LLESLTRFIRITRSSGIMRRYFVVNGFDGALTMLGLMMGFRVTEAADVAVAATACLGAAIALGISGISSAYVSEAAERQKELRDLEQAMMTDLSGATHGAAARLVPVLIAAVNGLAPLAMSLAIIVPLWLDMLGVRLPASPFDASLAVAFVIIFLLGVFLGRVSGHFWLWTGLRALLVGAVTVVLISVIT
jgi:predicted membrane protein (TIGR00267 family)